MRLCKQFIIFFLFILFPFFQAKGQYDFSVNATGGCSPLKVKFTYMTTATVDSVDTYYWSFGNGVTSYSDDPDTVIFTEGVYDPTLVLRFVNGAEVWIVKTDYLVIDPPPAEANFEYSRPSESFFFYLFESTTVLDTAAHDYTFTWDIEDFTPRVGQSQEITFPRVDTFSVMLTVSDENGCSSSASEEIVIIEEIVVPNVFTPGGDDDVNNYFVIRSNGGIVLRIRIYSRTGVLVYEMEGPVITWDGETASGDKLKSGVYFYTLEAVSGDPGKIYSKTGFLHMYRKE